MVVAVAPAEVSVGVVAVMPAVVVAATPVGVSAVVSVGALFVALAVAAVPPGASPALVYAFGT